jgi:hypothetical protein
MARCTGLTSVAFGTVDVQVQYDWSGGLDFDTTWFMLKVGARGSMMVEPLCYKQEGRGFET